MRNYDGTIGSETCLQKYSGWTCGKLKPVSWNVMKEHLIKLAIVVGQLKQRDVFEEPPWWNSEAGLRNLHDVTTVRVRQEPPWWNNWNSETGIRKQIIGVVITNTLTLDGGEDEVRSGRIVSSEKCIVYQSSVRGSGWGAPDHCCCTQLNTPGRGGLPLLHLSTLKAC